MGLLEEPDATSAGTDDGYLSDEETMPTGIAVALGSTAVVASAFVTAAVPVSAGAVRLGLVAACLGAFAAVSANAAAVAFVGVVAFLVFDGFLVNQLGQLSWHGPADVQRLFVFLAVSILGLVAGNGYRAVRRWRLWWRRAMWAAAQPRVTVAAEAGPDEGSTEPLEATPGRDEQPSGSRGSLWNGREISRG